jgi:hypothetical protein
MRRSQAASPKGGLRENRKIIWPKTMTVEMQDAWYARIDQIRRQALAPGPKRIFLPAARVIVAIEEVL